jgi:anti-anti-sigma factor
MNTQLSPPPRFRADCVQTPERLLLRFSGRLVLDPRVTTDWRSCLERTPVGTVAVDLDGVTEIDASGLGLLAELTHATRATGRRLAVVSASPRVRRLLALTRLDAAIEGVSASADCVAA